MMQQALQQAKRARRIRGKISGTKALPRLCVHRSNASMYAQLIDDANGKTLIGVSENSLEKLSGTKTEKAKALGMELAKRAKEKKITHVAFDRGRYRYHGRVLSFAQGAREGGLQF